MTGRPFARTRRACTVCGAVLSRYNSERRCAACVRSGRAEPAQPQPSAVHVGQQVAMLRKKVGLMRDELACLAELSPDLVCSVERGERDSISLPALLALAGVLRAPLAALQEAKSPGERLRSARRQRGMTIRELARESGLSETHISDLQSGRQVLMRLPPADALATALGLSVVYLAPWLAEKPTDGGREGSGNW